MRVRLYPMEQLFVCGQPVAVSLLTLGQIPVILPDRYLYRFDEMEKGNVTTRSFELTIAQRIWFWDILSWNKKFEEKTGKAVLGAYRAVARENVVN